MDLGLVAGIIALIYIAVHLIKEKYINNPDDYVHNYILTNTKRL